MNKSKLALSLLAVALIISIGANAFFGAQSLALNQKSSDSTKVDMVSTLSKVQVSVDAEIERIGNSIIYASQQLSTTGISGDQARNVIKALAANSSFIIEAATQNLDRQMMVVEPEAFHSSEGKIIGPQKWLNPNPVADITPCMTPVIMLIVNQSGCSIVAPIFNANKEIIGTVSSIFSPQAMINASVSAIMADKPYELIGMQLDGLMIYDSDPTQQGRNMFTDPAYASFTELLALGRHVVGESSGYGTYTFNLIGSSEIVQKECYWTTVNAYGQEWRLALNHAL